MLAGPREGRVSVDLHNQQQPNGHSAQTRLMANADILKQSAQTGNTEPNQA